MRFKVLACVSALALAAGCTAIGGTVRAVADATITPAAAAYHDAVCTDPTLATEVARAELRRTIYETTGLLVAADCDWLPGKTLDDLEAEILAPPEPAISSPLAPALTPPPHEVRPG